MAQVTRLGVSGFARPVYASFAGKVGAVSTATIAARTVDLYADDRGIELWADTRAVALRATTRTIATEG